MAGLSEKDAGQEIVVHPIVLLSIVDHYNRVAKGTNKRVVGTLLGETHDGKMHVTNCFAVPFEEDARDPSVWFLDHNFHENMFAMFKKVNTKERVVGWYSTGPKMKASDLSIHELYRKYCKVDPVMVLLDVQPRASLELPMDAYRSLEEATSDKQLKRSFYHIPSTVGAFEAEEVGVEHLLRDIRNASTSTLATRVADKLTAVKTLVNKLKEISDYLTAVLSGKLTVNPQILYNLQDIFNLLPEMTQEMVTSFSTETNDMMLVLYLSSILRTTMALHNLIDNKLANKELEEVDKKKDKENTPESDKNEGKDAKNEKAEK